MTARPVRLRLSRAKGFDLQAHSRATNGLPAVNVARPGKWGNPFKSGMNDDWGHWMTAADCVREFRCLFVDGGTISPTAIELAIAELRGKNLACWCRPNEPCHADVLLEMANDPVKASL